MRPLMLRPNGKDTLPGITLSVVMSALTIAGAAWAAPIPSTSPYAQGAVASSGQSARMARSRELVGLEFVGIQRTHSRDLAEISFIAVPLARSRALPEINFIGAPQGPSRSTRGGS